MISTNDILHGKILIVDDQAPNVALLEQLLKGAGYLAISSTTDASAVSQLHLLNHYDLILLDLNMPGMDGFQVMENLKQIEPDYLPVLVVTAQPEHKVRALKAGARDFVSKPFDLTEVLARVHNMLEVRLLHRETKRLAARLLSEQTTSERMVKDVPNAIDDHLKPRALPDGPTGADVVTGSSAELLVLFSDIMEFTRFAEGASARVLIGVLDSLSTRLDNVGGVGALVPTAAVNDAYLAAVGLPDATANRSIRAARLAARLTEAMDRFNGHAFCTLKLRLGLDTMPLAKPVSLGARSFDLSAGPPVAA